MLFDEIISISLDFSSWKFELTIYELFVVFLLIGIIIAINI